MQLTCKETVSHITLAIDTGRRPLSSKLRLTSVSLLFICVGPLALECVVLAVMMNE